MPVMKQLNMGGTTYDTVGEASVTRVVTTGTKIATITIDGTSSDLYAPSGTSVDPATSAPIMDGTAAVGSSAKYAREDHVHPTDTSRQETLVSGTNIKTVNGNSLLGSGDITIQSGGASRLTLYVQRNTAGAILYADSACTTTFIEACDWDYREAYNRIKSADIVEIRWIESASAGRDFFCSSIDYDFADDTVTVYSLMPTGVVYFVV